MVENMYIITLSNGLRVGNFSSPHSFTFIDGNVLPKVSDNFAKEMMLDLKETPVRNHKHGPKVKTVKKDFRLTPLLHEAIAWWVTIYETDQVDVVLVPLPVMDAMSKVFSESKLMAMPFRVISVADRVTKAIEIDKFSMV